MQISSQQMLFELPDRPGRTSERGGAYPGSSGGTTSQTQLTPEEEKQVRELATRDREVRTHEAAHAAAGGQYVRGGASFTFQQGPDGKSYAVGGEVSIDTSPVKGDPEATIQKMQQVQRAANAPADPSGQDRSVAAAAAAAEAAARAELAKQKSEEAKGGGKTAGYTAGGTKAARSVPGGLVDVSA